jgi:hypothetical protein
VSREDLVGAIPVCSRALEHLMFCLGVTLGHLFSTAAAVSFTALSPRPE